MSSENTGKIKVAVIAILGVLLPLISGGANLFTLIVFAVISIFLYRGVNWVKYLFIVISVLHAFTALTKIISPEILAFGKLFYIIYGIYRILSIVMLIGDKNIKDYFMLKKQA